MPDPVFGMLDLIGDRLERYRDRLGPFYRPLYLLTGVLAFLLCFALIVALPIVFLSDFEYVAFAHIAMIAVYFMLLLTIEQNVFDRFVYSAILFVVAAAAPVLVGGQTYVNMLTEADPTFFPQQATLPKLEFFLYAVLRGAGNIGWAVPLLFYLFTFHPRLRERHKVGDMRKRLNGVLVIALAMHLVAGVLLFWRDAVLQRFTASAEGAIPAVKRAVETAQWGYLAFSVLYLAVGAVVLLVIKFWARGDDRRLHIALVGGLAAAQVAYSLAGYHVRLLNTRFPAARTTASTVRAFEFKETGQIVFTLSFFDDVSHSKLGREWTPYCRCTNPLSGRFSFFVGHTADFRSQPDAPYREVDLLQLVFDDPPERRARTLFCQTLP